MGVSPPKTQFYGVSVGLPARRYRVVRVISSSFGSEGSIR